MRLILETWRYILIPCHTVKSLQLIWRSGTRRWNLRVPDLLMSCSDLVEIKGAGMIIPVMAVKVTWPILTWWWKFSGLFGYCQPFVKRRKCQQHRTFVDSLLQSKHSAKPTKYLERGLLLVGRYSNDDLKIWHLSQHIVKWWWVEDCCTRSRHKGQGQVITSHIICGV